MNANELADELDGFLKEQEQQPWGTKQVYLDQAATMLRQQQAELDAFKLQYYNTGYSIQLRDKDETIRQQQAEIEALKANREHDFGLGEASGFIKGHQANPYQSITDTKIEPTVVSYTHPAKEHFEDEPQAEELHEIMQSNAELTDEEILEELLIPKSEWDSYKAHHCLKQIRAILRKAQENG